MRPTLPALGPVITSTSCPTVKNVSELVLISGRVSIPGNLACSPARSAGWYGLASARWHVPLNSGRSSPAGNITAVFVRRRFMVDSLGVPRIVLRRPVPFDGAAEVHPDYPLRVASTPACGVHRPLGHRFAFEVVGDGNDSVAHEPLRSGAPVCNFPDDHSFRFDFRYLVKLGVGLVVSPAVGEHVAHLEAVNKTGLLSMALVPAGLRLAQAVQPIVDIGLAGGLIAKAVVEIGLARFAVVPPGAWPKSAHGRGEGNYGGNVWGLCGRAVWRGVAVDYYLHC